MRIRPVPDELSAPFWDGARRHRLVLRHCLRCGRFHHPPRALCPWCAGAELDHRQVPGEGRVFSHTTVPDPEAGAHTNVVVELSVQDGLLLVGGLPGPRPGWLEIGAPVRVWFEQVDEDLVLPQFAPVEP